ncbi:MAG TPA: NADPH-dependent oxidoreductase [Bacteroidales bacterium]|nr:NADPH-dependent oxidoreductase [Bacteroidales bacterium]
MDTIDTIFNHRTIRKYKRNNIPEDLLTGILQAGTRASTTGNMQVYSIIVTRDEEKKKKLCEYHFNQKMVLEAPVLLTFCADYHRFNQWCRQRNAEPGYDNFLSFFTAAIDALLAAQNVALAAEANGLGICYLGTTTYNADKLIEFFGCPDGVVPVTTLVLGYPDEEPGLTDRLPLEAIVHNEQYETYTPEKIDKLYKEKEELPLTKSLLIENQLETLAQIFTRKRYTKIDNIHFSKSLLDVIHKQGFMNNE